MQAQDTTLYLLKLWPWVEANKNRLIGAAVVVAAAVIAVSFFVYRNGQKEVAAGRALTQLIASSGGATADAFLKIAAEYPGTIAGQRAQLQGAAALFDAGRYPDAQAQFQKFLEAHPDDQFSSQAALGVAACLEAQNQTNQAVAAYQRLAGSSSDAVIVMAAKFALGRIAEAQGRFNDALVFYQDVARLGVGTALGSQAAARLAELRSRLPAPASAPGATAPLQFNP